jgi:hypothetical protein
VDDLLSPQILLQQFLHLFLVMLGLTQQVGKYMFTTTDTGLSLRQATLGPLVQLEQQEQLALHQM